MDWNWNRPKSEWTRLADLLRRLARLPGEFRLRLSSIEATETTRELIAVMGEYADKVCPHLHICLQSGSDAVLRRMRRRWGAQRFLDCCQYVKEALDRPALTTDVLVGFPGETDADFEQTCARSAYGWLLQNTSVSLSARALELPLPACRTRFRHM